MPKSICSRSTIITYFHNLNETFVDVYVCSNYLRSGNRYLAFPVSVDVGRCWPATDNVSASKVQSGCAFSLHHWVFSLAYMSKNCYFYVLTRIIAQSHNRKHNFWHRWIACRAENDLSFLQFACRIAEIWRGQNLPHLVRSRYKQTPVRLSVNICIWQYVWRRHMLTKICESGSYHARLFDGHWVLKIDPKLKLGNFF